MGRLIAALVSCLTIVACGSPSSSGVSKMPEAAPVQAVAIPRSELRAIVSERLGRTYDLHIKLPPSYAKPESAERRYPVLYLNDATYNFQVASAAHSRKKREGTP